MSDHLRVRPIGIAGALVCVCCLLVVQTGERTFNGAGGDDPDALEEAGQMPMPRPDSPAEAMAFRLSQWRDEHGEYPPDGLVVAKAHVDAMRAADARLSPTAGINPLSWAWLGPGNIGGRMRSLVIDSTAPNTMLAGSVGGGIFKTVDGGATWAPANDFMANLAVSTIVINPANHLVLYAGTGEGFYNGDGLRGAGVFKSTDGGTTWNQLASTNLSAWQYVNRLAVSPAGVLLAATRTGIYRSADAGATWTHPGTTETTDIEFDPTGSKAIASGYAGDAFFSNDGGVTWTAAAGLPAITFTLRRVEVAYARSSPNIVYASVDFNGGSIYKSTDGGATYALISVPPQKYLGGQGWYDNALWVDPTNSSTLVLGGIDLWKSTDGGATLTHISNWAAAPASAHADHHGIFEHPSFGTGGNATVFFANDGGVYKTSNVYTVGGGTSLTIGWTALNNNLGVTQFYGAAGNATTGVILGGTQDNGTLKRTNAGGTTWTTEFGGDGGYNAVDPVNDNNLYGEYVGLQLHRSLNGGTATDWINGLFWTGSAYICKAPPFLIADSCNKSGANFIAPFIMDPNNRLTLLAGGASLWRTFDSTTPNTSASGPSWAAIKAPVPTNNFISAIAVAPTDSNQIWVGHNASDLYKTTNGLAGSPTWTRMGAGVLPARQVLRVRVDPTNASIVYVTYGGFNATNLWRSVNGGTTWAPISGSGVTGLPAVPVRDIGVNPGLTNWLYAATEVGVFASQDGGTSWNVPQDGPANVSVDELFWLGSALVAATHGRGLFKATPAVSPASSDDLIVDFGAFGVWMLFDGNTGSWARLHTATAKNIVTGDLDGNGISEVIIDFGATGIWVWANNSGWFQLHAATTTRMVTGDLDGNGKVDLLIEFPGYGIWVWANNTSWFQLHASGSNNIVTADLDGNGKKEAIVDFPVYGIWVWANNASWYQLHSANSRLMTAGDFDGNGKADLIVDFAGYGLWGYSNNSSWSQVHPLNASHLAVGDIDGGGRSDLIVDFGNPNGIWKLLNGTAWSQINTLTSSNLMTADIDGNGKADVIVSFGAAGLWEYANNTSWIQLHTVSPGLVAAARLNAP
jgi:photosystem II stability/assembly factor-like uncharacterized protein